jgi:hypothetical protein
MALHADYFTNKNRSPYISTVIRAQLYNTSNYSKLCFCYAPRYTLCLYFCYASKKNRVSFYNLERRDYFIFKQIYRIAAGYWPHLMNLTDCDDEFSQFVNSSQDITYYW